MLTRCPHCDTHFRVSSQQIKARSGKVRCGACHEVFNALATLVDEPVINTESEPTAEPQLPSHEDIDIAATTLELDMVAALAADEAAAQSAIHSSDAHVDETVNTEIVTDDTRPDVYSWQDEATPDQQSDAEAPPSHYSALTVDHNLTPDGHDTDHYESDYAAAYEPAAGQESEPLTGDPSELADYLAAPITPVAAPRQTWPWVLGSGVALLLLLMQTVYYFRVDLGKLRPEWRPHLQAACKPFNCDVPRPRDIDSIGIETSDLRPDPQQPGHLTLKAVLRSQAAYAQEWPLLELTLTDVNDQKIAVKHFRAGDYLSKDKRIAPTLAAGFPAKGEVAISLPLDVGYLAAAGYRLYVFYP